MTAPTNTINQMQQQLQDISRALGRLEGSIDTFIKQMAKQDERTTALDTRVGKVENRQHWYSGAGATLGALFGALGVKLFHG